MLPPPLLAAPLFTLEFHVPALGFAPPTTWHSFTNASDEYYSAGWVGLANRHGVNGGVQLWHNDNVRQYGGRPWQEACQCPEGAVDVTECKCDLAPSEKQRNAAQWSLDLVTLTHTGSQRAWTDLAAFGLLQEQDLLNFAIIERPHIWYHVDCVFNYLPKTVFGPYGGHVSELAEGTAGTWIDRCVGGGIRDDGEPGPGGFPKEDFGCSCGRRVSMCCGSLC